MTVSLEHSRRYMAQRRGERKERGLCPMCGEKPEPGFVYCGGCRKNQAAVQKRYRKRVRQGVRKASALRQTLPQ